MMDSLRSIHEDVSPISHRGVSALTAATHDPGSSTNGADLTATTKNVLLQRENLPHQLR